MRHRTLIGRVFPVLVVAVILLPFWQRGAAAANQSVPTPLGENRSEGHSDRGTTLSTGSPESAFANAWYYLFSTIPQVFAAIYGITFALVLYRLQQIDNATEAIAKSLGDFANRVNLTIPYRRWCADLAARQDWAGYLVGLRKLPESNAKQLDPEHDPVETRRYLDIHGEEIRRHLARKKTIWTKLHRNLAITMLLIGGTASVIPFGHRVGERELFVGWAVVVALTCTTLFLYFRLLVALVRPLDERDTHHIAAPDREDQR